jgi:hypothetical protein
MAALLAGFHSASTPKLFIFRTGRRIIFAPDKNPQKFSFVFPEPTHSLFLGVFFVNRTTRAVLLDALGLPRMRDIGRRQCDKPRPLRVQV